MVFLGVWLGFLAENLREDRRERADERVSLARILRDLDQNQVDLEGNRNRALAGNEAVNWILEQADRIDVDSDSLQHHLTSLQYHSVLGANDSEYAALKNAGRLMIIRDDELRELLTRHYEFYSVIALGHERENVELRRALVAIAPFVRRGPPDESQFPTLKLVGSDQDILSEPTFLMSVAELGFLRSFLVGAYAGSLSRVDELRQRISAQLNDLAREDSS